MNLGGKNFTNFQNVRVKGVGSDAGVIRIKSGTDPEGTISVGSLEDNVAWSLPIKGGTFAVAGTFTVNQPAIPAFSTYGTHVAVSGIRIDDGIVAAIQNTFATIGTTNWAVRGFAELAGCQAGNGGVLLTFVNPTDTATVYKDLVIAYAAVR